MVGKLQNWDLGEILVVYKRCKQEIADDKRKSVYCESDFLIYFYEDCFLSFKLENNNLHDLESNSILRINSEGKIYLYLSSMIDEVDISITNKCNSNCIMCPVPEAVRRQDRIDTFEWNRQLIEILPDCVGYINITGGEPTLGKDEFYNILQLIADKFKNSDFQLLTNGRSFSIPEVLDKTLHIVPRGMRIAIPVHSSDENVHDKITQVKGSFQQTDKGIRNLLSHRQTVEIRIVVSKINIDTVVNTAEYIVKNYKNLLCVNFIGMEMLGNAAKNKGILWIDYDKAFHIIKKAIDILVKNGIDVQLYNFPLCAIDRGYWSIVAKSISDYKIRYMEECCNCKVKELCGGFFASTKHLMNPNIKPIG